MNDRFCSDQSVIVTLDVDPFLFDRLGQVSQAGFSSIEINTSDNTLLLAIREKYPHLRIGAGNILNVDQLQRAYEAGVHFATSPGLLPELVQTASIYNMHYLPGIATPSEAMQLLTLGCHHAKPYPADFSFCALLNKNLPMLRLYPAEIEWEEAERYLSMPSVAAIHLLNPSIKHLQALFHSMTA